MITLDHLAVSGETLEAAQALVEDALEVRMAPGGEHDVFFTHNALLGLEDGLYLEAIAINPDAPVPGRPRWFDLDRFSGDPRPSNWICRTEDLDTVLNRMPFDLGAPVDLQRNDLRWQMAVPDSGILPFDNCAPALIRWRTDSHPATMLPASHVRLRRLTIHHPEAELLKSCFGAALQDDRVAFEAGAPGLMADFETPHGPRTLGG